MGMRNWPDIKGGGNFLTRSLQDWNEESKDRALGRGLIIKRTQRNLFWFKVGHGKSLSRPWLLCCGSPRTHLLLPFLLFFLSRSPSRFSVFLLEEASTGSVFDFGFGKGSREDRRVFLPQTVSTVSPPQGWRQGHKGREMRKAQDTQENTDESLQCSPATQQMRKGHTWMRGVEDCPGQRRSRKTNSTSRTGRRQRAIRREGNAEVSQAQGAGSREPRVLPQRQKAAGGGSRAGGSANRVRSSELEGRMARLSWDLSVTDLRWLRGSLCSLFPGFPTRH